MVDISIQDMKKLLGAKTEPEGKEIGKALVDDDGKITVYDTTLRALSDTLIKESKEKLMPEITKGIAFQTEKDVSALSKRLQAELDDTTAALFKLAGEVRPLEVRLPDKNIKVEGVRHSQFENLLLALGVGQPVLMVGPAGTGKTAGAKQAGDALGLTFHSISVGSQTSKSDLVGYMDGGGTYRTTQFRDAYQHGGLFLLDEADAGNSNVLILLNAALSNGYMAFPDGMVERHPDFRMVATANTYGNGASRQYVGRNQLDAATLDRFTVLNWDIDDKIETAMAGTSTDGAKWLRVVRAVRARVSEQLELRVVISPRATLRGAQLLAAGMEFETVLGMALTSNIPAAAQPELVNLASATWRK
jgi:cobaltochelatase CobS